MSFIDTSEWFKNLFKSRQVRKLPQDKLNGKLVRAKFEVDLSSQLSPNLTRNRAMAINKVSHYFGISPEELEKILSASPVTPSRDDLEQRIRNYTKWGWSQDEAWAKISTDLGISPKELQRILTQSPAEYASNQSLEVVHNRYEYHGLKEHFAKGLRMALGIGWSVGYFVYYIGCLILWGSATIYYGQVWGIIGILLNIILMPLFTIAFPFVFFMREGNLPWLWIFFFIGMIIMQFVIGFVASIFVHDI
jgi:hypothetical protein